MARAYTLSTSHSQRSIYYSKCEYHQACIRTAASVYASIYCHMKAYFLKYGLISFFYITVYIYRDYK